jgi:hypothetical protein
MTSDLRLDTSPALTLELEAEALGYDVVRVNGFVVGRRRKADECGSCGGKMTGADEESDLQGRGLCRLCR